MMGLVRCKIPVYMSKLGQSHFSSDSHPDFEEHDA